MAGRRKTVNEDAPKSKPQQCPFPFLPARKYLATFFFYIAYRRFEVRCFRFLAMSQQISSDAPSGRTVVP